MNYNNYAEETKKRNNDLITQLKKENRELKEVQEDLVNQKKKTRNKENSSGAFAK